MELNRMTTNGNATVARWTGSDGGAASGRGDAASADGDGLGGIRPSSEVYGILVTPADAATVRVIADAIISRFRWRGDAERMRQAASSAAWLLTELMR